LCLPCSAWLILAYVFRLNSGPGYTLQPPGFQPWNLRCAPPGGWLGRWSPRGSNLLKIQMSSISKPAITQPVSNWVIGYQSYYQSIWVKMQLFTSTVIVGWEFTKKNYWFFVLNQIDSSCLTLNLNLSILSYVTNFQKKKTKKTANQK
jgi:hypothetical protein